MTINTPPSLSSTSLCLRSTRARVRQRDRSTRRLNHPSPSSLCHSVPPFCRHSTTTHCQFGAENNHRHRRNVLSNSASGNQRRNLLAKVRQFSTYLSSEGGLHGHLASDGTRRVSAFLCAWAQLLYNICGRVMNGLNESETWGGAEKWQVAYGRGHMA